MKTILVHQVNFHHFFFLALNTSEQSGQCCRPFWLHTVHSSAPQRFLVPFLVPRHQRHGTKPRPSHVRHGPSPSAFYSTRMRKSTSATCNFATLQLSVWRNAPPGVCAICKYLKSNQLSLQLSCLIQFQHCLVILDAQMRTNIIHNTHGHTCVHKHCTITTSYKAHERGVQQILGPQDLTHHSPQCVLH